MACKIEFVKIPQKVIKFRSDTLTTLKDDNQKIVSVKISNVECRPCKLIVKLLLKEPEDKYHFYQLCNTSNKLHVREEYIEYDIDKTNSIIKLDFFGIKKALKKDAMKYLREHFNKNAEDIYKKNSSTIVVQLSLVDSFRRTPFHILRYELSDKNDNIIIKAYSPSILLFDDDQLEVTFVLENAEKDSENIYLELDISNSTKIMARELTKPTSIKNVFIFSLKQVDLNTKHFQARLRRKGSNDGCSDWKVFTLTDRILEIGKRKINTDYDYSPQNKIPRQITSAISENSISEYNFDEYFSDPCASFTCIKSLNTNKQQLKDLCEKKMLSKIARVGHDFAFGFEITTLMKNVSMKLPVVFIIQDDVGDSPLHNAILKNQEQRAVEILNIVSQVYPEDLYNRNTSDHTALILAPACDVSPEFVERLLHHGFSQKDKDIQGNNALSIAIEYKNTKILETLVKNASETKVFQDCIHEIEFLIKKTVFEKYFEGFKIFMESSLAIDQDLCCLTSESLNLDSYFASIFNNFIDEINTNFTPLPELDENNWLDNDIGSDFDIDDLLSSL